MPLGFVCGIKHTKLIIIFWVQRYIKPITVKNILATSLEGQKHHLNNPLEKVTALKCRCFYVLILLYVVL